MDNHGYLLIELVGLAFMLPLVAIIEVDREKVCLQRLRFSVSWIYHSFCHSFILQVTNVNL